MQAKPSVFGQSQVEPPSVAQPSSNTLALSAKYVERLASFRATRSRVQPQLESGIGWPQSAADMHCCTLDSVAFIWLTSESQLSAQSRAVQATSPALEQTQMLQPSLETCCPTA